MSQTTNQIIGHKIQELQSIAARSQLEFLHKREKATLDFMTEQDRKLDDLGTQHMAKIIETFESICQRGLTTVTVRMKPEDFQGFRMTLNNNDLIPEYTVVTMMIERWLKFHPEYIGLKYEISNIRPLTTIFYI